MDLMELAGPNYKTLDHNEIYHRIVKNLGGPDAFRPYLPFDLQTLAVKYKHDKHFNQNDMAGHYLTVWDRNAGFRIAATPIQPPTYEPSGKYLWKLVNAHDVTEMSLSEAVCTLKHAAKELLIQEGLIPDNALV